MIREDRIQLNDRFIKVFKLLQDRGDVILNDRGGKGMGDFAKKVLGNRAYGHIIRAFLTENDKRVIDYHQARIVCDEFGINESYLIDGTGTPFGRELPKVQLADSNVNAIRPNIIFTSVQAFAGSGDSASDSFGSQAEDNELFALPGVSGAGLVAFPVEGNSMEPVIADGDIVICRQIDGVGDLKDNGIYAVKSNGHLWIKHVQRIKNNKGRTVQLKMISANHLEHEPFIHDVSEYTRLYKVIRKISEI